MCVGAVSNTPLASGVYFLFLVECEMVREVARLNLKGAATAHCGLAVYLVITKFMIYGDV